MRGIEQILEDGTMHWKIQQESYRIFQLKTLNPNGMNVDECCMEMLAGVVILDVASGLSCSWSSSWLLG